MKRTLVIICTLLAAAGCERSDRQEQETSPSLLPPPNTELGTPRAEPSQLEPSMNAPATAAEERQNMSGTDKDKDEPSAGATTGSESSADRAITQRVREAVTGDDSLSATAKNVTIQTTDGVVTLRGPVQSSKEKSQVGDMAKDVDGVKRVNNQLEISGD